MCVLVLARASALIWKNENRECVSASRTPAFRVSAFRMPSFRIAAFRENVNLGVCEL